jgi:hypothetical protein
MKGHRWTEQDDIAALYFYKFGNLRRSSSIDVVGDHRGMGGGSLRMRVANFRAIDAGGSLDMLLTNLSRCIDATLICQSQNCENWQAYEILPETKPCG